jgi:hypothetical protein
VRGWRSGASNGRPRLFHTHSCTAAQMPKQHATTQTPDKRAAAGFTELRCASAWRAVPPAKRVVSTASRPGERERTSSHVRTVQSPTGSEQHSNTKPCSFTSSLSMLPPLWSTSPLKRSREGRRGGECQRHGAGTVGKEVRWEGGKGEGTVWGKTKTIRNELGFVSSF